MYVGKGYLRTPQEGGLHTTMLIVSEGRIVFQPTDVVPGGYLRTPQGGRLHTVMFSTWLRIKRKQTHIDLV